MQWTDTVYGGQTVSMMGIGHGGPTLAMVDRQWPWWTGNVYGGQAITVADRQQCQTCTGFVHHNSYFLCLVSMRL